KTRNDRKRDQTIRGGKRDRADNQIDPRESPKRPAQRRSENDHGAIENPTDAADKRIRLDRANCGRENIRRIGGHARQHQVRPNIFKPNRGRRTALVLLGREQQFVEGNATGALTIRGLTKSVPSDRIGILVPFGSVIAVPMSIITSPGVRRIQKSAVWSANAGITSPRY